MEVYVQKRGLFWVASVLGAPSEPVVIVGWSLFKASVMDSVSKLFDKAIRFVFIG